MPMRFFPTAKLTGRKAAKTPTITVCAYDLGAGFEARHKLVPLAEARRKPLVRYRTLATPDEELVAARKSPLDELAAWAAAEAAAEGGESAVARGFPRACVLTAAFAADVDEVEDLEVVHSPRDTVSGPSGGASTGEQDSPGTVDLEQWLASSPAQPSLLYMNTSTSPEVACDA